LDVNLAVNNLLQRDDEGDDPTDDEDPYMHGDDLISLLDINSHHSSEGFVLDSDAALFDEDSFRFTRRLTSGANSGSGTTGRASGHSSSSTMSAITDAIERESRKASSYGREHRWYDSYRDELFSSSRYDSSTAASGINSRHDSNHGTHHGGGHYHHSQYTQQPSHSSLHHHHHHHHHHNQRDVSSLNTGNLQTNESLNAEACRKQGQTSNQMSTTFSFGEVLEYWKEKV
jgi:hypothetical protein